MNSDMSLHDLINYARTMETIASHLQTMRLEDNNTATATTALINKVADEQRQPSNYPRQYQRLNDGNRQRKQIVPPRTQTNRRSVNRIENDQRNPRSSGSDTEYVFHTGKMKNLPCFNVSFGYSRQTFNALADSGATINILSEADFKRLRPAPHLRPTKTVISGFGVKETTPALGRFNICLEFMGTACQADIHVIKSPEKPIIGWETCKRLGLLSTHKLSINHISDSDTQIPPSTLKLLDDHADLFNGLGKLKGKKVHLHIDETIPPVAQR
ncbi:unnamed protein product [Acanthosepion pharaonis]|uniref:Peptidase A2 domain-containing protein n=1 Tax=Acanthosepion pharaonis TaxID=158019 RepID=A0A812CCV5_ACAPH|nr:unnamed protein product [Sepia pharaonis]